MYNHDSIPSLNCKSLALKSTPYRTKLNNSTGLPRFDKQFHQKFISLASIHNIKFTKILLQNFKKPNLPKIPPIPTFRTKLLPANIKP